MDQELLKSIVHYNNETGIFTWSVDRGGRVKKGNVCGSIKQGYIIIKIMGKSYPAHRLAFLYMIGRFPEIHVDHINGDRSDNRFCNLVECTQKENAKNRSLSLHNKSGTTGVSFRKRNSKWVASITKNYKKISLGEFSEKKDAILARKEAEVLHGFNPNHGSKSRRSYIEDNQRYLKNKTTTKISKYIGSKDNYTQKRLKELLHYNPETGVFTWKINRSGKKVGDVAGCPAKRQTNTYMVIGCDNFTFLAHRLAWLYMTGELPNHVIDHMDGNGLNNSWTNLRDVTPSENLRNLPIRSDNKSGVNGVYWNKKTCRWVSNLITLDGKPISKSFKLKEDAINHRKEQNVIHGYHENHGRSI